MVSVSSANGNLWPTPAPTSLMGNAVYLLLQLRIEILEIVKSMNGLPNPQSTGIYFIHATKSQPQRTNECWK